MVTIIIVTVVALSFGYLLGCVYTSSGYSPAKQKFTKDLAAIQETHKATLNTFQEEALREEQRLLAHYRNELNKLAQEESLIIADMPSEDQLN